MKEVYMPPSEQHKQRAILNEYPELSTASEALQDLAEKMYKGVREVENEYMSGELDYDKWNSVLQEVRSTLEQLQLEARPMHQQGRSESTSLSNFLTKEEAKLKFVESITRKVI